MTIPFRGKTRRTERTWNVSRSPVILLMITVMLLIASSISSTATAAETVQDSKTASSSSPSLTETLVRVFDNVLSEQTAVWLDDFAVEEYERTHNKNKNNEQPEGQPQQKQEEDLGHQFVFPLAKPQNHPPLQQMLNQILLQLYETNDDDDDEKKPLYYVEFWTRQTWNHILAHQDMDEGHEKRLRDVDRSMNSNNDDNDVQTSQYKTRHPQVGNVLYLKKGRSVIGPTIVFNTTKGGNLVRLQQDNNVASSSSTTTLISVPVVPGRLLQFKGDLLHSVPRPFHVYWTFQQELPPKTYPLDEFERSVILFNLWPIDDGPVTDKVIVGGDSSSSRSKRNFVDQKCNPRSSWTEVDVVPYQQQQQKEQEQEHQPVNDGSPPENPSSSSWSSYLMTLLWTTIGYEPSAQPKQEQFQIPLTGNVQRRGTESYTVEMQAPEGALEEIFQYTSQVTSVDIEPYQPTTSRLFGIEF